MSVLKLKLLGQMECSLPSGAPLSLSTRKADVLLAYLALTPGLRHPRERLVNLLWSDRSEEQARNSLRQCLSAIKKSLGDMPDTILQVDRTTLSLNPELIDVDLHEFERLAGEAEFDSLTAAANLYHGEFLEGISIRDAACQDWLEGERARFKRQFIEILTRLGQNLLEAGNFSAAIKSAERLVDQDPLGEAGWRLLMQSYAGHGERNHALQAYKRCQKILYSELEVEPEATTIALRDDIAGGQAVPGLVPTVNELRALPESQVQPNESSGHGIAVLPFDNLSGDPAQEYFSDGITDSIILNLSLFPGLYVKSRNSSFAFKQQIKTIGEISKELEVNYLVEGSIRKSGARIRITAQLIEAASGNQIWGNRYDAELADLFDLEEDLSRTIAATVTGQIDSDLQRIAIAKGAAHQESYDLLLSGRYHVLQFNGPDTVIGIDKLNQCLAQDPDNVHAHALLYYGHCMNWLERWVEDYEPSFESAGEHVRKALALGPEVGFVQVSYAEYLIFCREFEKSLAHLDKALAINPNDADALATRAFVLIAQGEYASALEIAEIGYRLDPYHPWCDWSLAEAQFFVGRYEDALHTIAISKNAPGFIRIYTVAASIKLGKMDQAREALREFVKFARENMFAMPKTRDEWVTYTTNNSPYQDRHINEELIDYLMQAGLDEELASISPAESPDQYPTILVLPFSNLSGDPEQEYFSDGITESVIQNLSSFSGLNVKSRHTSFAFKDSTLGIDEIASELEVQYIVDGSVRKRGDQVRIAVQLGDTGSGNQIWGKRYDAELDRIFELEEELSQTIASTISGRIGKQVKLSKYQKPAINLKSYDYLMRGWYHAEKINAADTDIAIAQFQKCIEIDPQNADAHAVLTAEYTVQLFENWTSNRSKTLELARQHIEKALELEPDNALAHSFMAEHCHYKRNFEQAMFHAEKTIELNPVLPDGHSMKAMLLASARQYDEAVALAERSIQIDPHHPYSGWAAGEVFRNAGDHERAIRTFRSVPHTSPSMIAQISSCLVELGKLDQARAEMTLYLELAHQHMPILPTGIEQWRQLWYEHSPYQFAEDFEKFFNSLLKAGLCDHTNDESDDIPSIAVLPFENMSGDPEQEYFSDGITNDIVTTLSHIRRLRVVARHSTLAYKEHKPSVSDIAEEQGVRYILDGSVRKSGDRIRVNAQLIDSQSGENCWAEKYDRNLKDIFAVQDAITKKIVVEMQVHLLSGDSARETSVGTRSIKAWELVSMAWDLQDSYIEDNMLKARRQVDEALKLDPEYSAAWVVLGWTHWQAANVGFSESIDDSIREARNAADKALSIDPENAEALVLKGSCHITSSEPGLAVETCSKAVEISPGNAEVQALTAYALVYAGEYDKALPHHEASLRLCPICPNWFQLVGGTIYQRTGDLDKAIAAFRKGVEIEPESPLCRYYLIDALMDAGREKEARACADEIRALDSRFRISGMLHSHSHNKDIREGYRANLEKVGFEEYCA
jgi:TolB-like protein/DNA-binding SARP family transcriptional activator/lipoprotein NlpI